MADYDDDRPNWREIDRKRERSRFYGRQQEKTSPDGERLQEGPRDRWQSGRMKEAIDRIFEGKKGTVDHDKAFRKLHQSYGSNSFLKNVNNYIEKYGLPDDAPTLLLMLDGKDPKIMLDVMEKIREVFPSLQQGQKDDALRKLSILAMSDRSKEVRSKAEEMNEELS